MERNRFFALWCGALGIMLLCLLATTPPLWQAGYPREPRGPYFAAVEDRVDINTAPAAELRTLPGIGETKAQRIIEYRRENGPFRCADDLAGVEGISSGIIDAVRAYITTGET